MKPKLMHGAPVPTRRRCGRTLIDRELVRLRGGRRVNSGGLGVTVGVLIAFVAELRVPVGGTISFEKTLGGTHFTLWGDSAEIRACVSVVASVASILKDRG